MEDKKLEKLLDKIEKTCEEMKELELRSFCYMHGLDYDKMEKQYQDELADEAGLAKANDEYIGTDKQWEDFERKKTNYYNDEYQNHLYEKWKGSDERIYA